MPRGRKPNTAAEVKPEAVAAEQTAAAPKRKPAKKADKTMTESIILQAAGVEWDVNAVKEQVIAAYVAEGHRRGRISDLSLFLKPEEHKVYYVINGKITGSIDVD